MTNKEEARQIVESKNQSERQSVLNLQIAKAYLAGADNGIATRTWQNAIEALTNIKRKMKFVTCQLMSSAPVF